MRHIIKKQKFLAERKISKRFESEKDLEKIGEVVEIKVSKEIGLLRLEMNQRFDETNNRVSGVEINILKKIEEIKTMESEDIQAIYADIAKIKKRLPV